MRTRSLLIPVAALAVALTAPAAFGASGQANKSRDRVKTTKQAAVLVQASFGQTAKQFRVVSARDVSPNATKARVVTRVAAVPRVAARGVGSYSCYIRTDSSGRLKAYNPIRYNSSGRSYTLKWILFPYLLNKARRVAGHAKKDWEFCMTGGSDVSNGYHQYRSEGSMAFGRKADQTVGTKWGTKVVNGTVGSSMGLKFAAGPVTISATTGVGGGSHSGSTGRDGDIESVSNMEPYNNNRVNALYSSGHTWRWQGTGDYQGNNGHLLVELNQTDNRAFSYYIYGTLRAFCSHPFGIKCGSFN